MRAQKPDALLSDSDGIPALMPQARRLLELRRTLAQLLPAALARSTSIANYKNGKVVVFAENSAVAAKLRLLRPALCEQLAQSGVEVTGMDVGVQPTAGPDPRPEKCAELTEQAAASLTRLCAQLPDSELKSSIGRLAARSRSKR